MANTNLQTIAAAMKRQAAANLNKQIHQRLTGGLSLKMTDTLTHHRLSLVRAGTPPSRQEIELIRRDFEIPAITSPTANTQRVNSKIFHIVRLIWPRLGHQMQLTDTGNKIIVTIRSKNDQR